MSSRAFELRSTAGLCPLCAGRFIAGQDGYWLTLLGAADAAPGAPASQVVADRTGFRRVENGTVSVGKGRHKRLRTVYAWEQMVDGKWRRVSVWENIVHVECARQRGYKVPSGRTTAEKGSRTVGAAHTLAQPTAIMPTPTATTTHFCEDCGAPLAVTAATRCSVCDPSNRLTAMAEARGAIEREQDQRARALVRCRICRDACDVNGTCWRCARMGLLITPTFPALLAEPPVPAPQPMPVAPPPAPAKLVGIRADAAAGLEAIRTEATGNARLAAEAAARPETPYIRRLRESGSLPPPVPIVDLAAQAQAERDAAKAARAAEAPKPNTMPEDSGAKRFRNIELD